MSGEKYESWCRGLIGKYPAATLAILSRLCEVGLAKGTVSANDISDMVYPKPHVVGACFKLMQRIGFAKDNTVIASTRKKSHSSFVFQWKLVDHSKAVTFLSECRTLLMGQEQNAATQTLLKL